MSIINQEMRKTDNIKIHTTKHLENERDVGT